ncbi:tol-pal system YbgF family protein [Planctomycetota bacterium]
MVSFLTFVTLSLFMFISNVASAGIAVEEGQALPQTIQTDPNASHRLDLLRVEISAPKDRKDEESKNKLKRLIEQVRSVQFESVPQDFKIPVVHDEVPVLEPNETLPKAPAQKTEKVEEIKIEQPSHRISGRTLKVLKNLLQHPDELKDPLELGEILFNSGNTKDAVFFYEEALKRADPNEVRSSRDRAWIMFQLGNCLRNHELPAAAEIYRKLLIEYPDSPWADLAKAQRELIEWRLKEKPHELIDEPDKRKASGMNIR